MSAVKERDIDLVIIQLAETSPEFRDWVWDLFVGQEEVDGFLGASHSVGTRYGESDIELGFTTGADDRHLLLIENKIDASFQEDQIDRYFQRGDRYVSDEHCDEYTVGLFAPERYVGQSEQNSFDTVVTYEDLLSELDSISHDGGPFFEDLVEMAIEKQEQRWESPYQLYEDANGRIMQTALSEVRDLVVNDATNRPNYEIGARSPWLKSLHEDHPESILYRFKIQLEQDQHTITPGDVEIRMDIEGDTDLSNEMEELQAEVNQTDREKFKFSGGSSLGVVHAYWRDVDRSDLQDEQFLEEVADKYAELIEIGHRVFTSPR